MDCGGGGKGGMKGWPQAQGIGREGIARRSDGDQPRRIASERGIEGSGRPNAHESMGSGKQGWVATADRPGGKAD